MKLEHKVMDVIRVVKASYKALLKMMTGADELTLCDDDNGNLPNSYYMKI